MPKSTPAIRIWAYVGLMVTRARCLRAASPSSSRCTNPLYLRDADRCCPLLTLAAETKEAASSPGGRRPTPPPDQRFDVTSLPRPKAPPTIHPVTGLGGGHEGAFAG